MQLTRNLGVPLHGARLTPGAALIAAMALTLMALAPALAAPAGGAPDSAANQATHVTTCNVTFDAGGNLLLNGSALTAAEAAVVDPLLAGDASIAAALELAADANADACVNLAIDLAAPSAVLNADISLCGSVVLTAEGVTIAGTEISADLLSAELINILEAAAAANAEACLDVTVTNNEVVVGASVAICLDATLLDTGVVSVDIGGTEFFFDGTLIDAGGLLDVGVTVEVSLLVVGTVDVTGQSAEVFIVVTACAAAPTLAPTATPSTAAPATQAPGGASQLPNTRAAASSEPTGGMMIVTILALVTLASVGVLGYRATSGRTR